MSSTLPADDTLEAFRVRLDVERPLSYDNKNEDGSEDVADVQLDALGHLFKDEVSAWRFAFDVNILSLRAIEEVCGDPVHGRFANRYSG